MHNSNCEISQIPDERLGSMITIPFSADKIQSHRNEQKNFRQMEYKGTQVNYWGHDVN